MRRVRAPTSAPFGRRAPSLHGHSHAGRLYQNKEGATTVSARRRAVFVAEREHVPAWPVFGSDQGIKMHRMQQLSTAACQ